MSDIHGSGSANTYIQVEGDKDDWDNYFGEGGNDWIQMWQGQAIGGPGDDHIEQLPSTEFWRELSVAYWDAPDGVVVDLDAGWAQDGWGSIDTLVGVDNVNTGWRDDQVYGNAGDNRFSSGGGHDMFDGRGGLDSMVLPWVGNAPGTIDDFTIAVSVDGTHATITSSHDGNLHIELTSVERITADWDQPYFDIASFIDPQAMADDGLTALPAQRWNAALPMGSAATVSFSFVESAPGSGPGAPGFLAFTPAEREHVREILASVSAVTNLTFVEVNESQAPGQIRFGTSQ